MYVSVLVWHDIVYVRAHVQCTCTYADGGMLVNKCVSNDHADCWGGGYSANTCVAEGVREVCSVCNFIFCSMRYMYVHMHQ